jgi:hypothetical protein
MDLNRVRVLRATMALLVAMLTFVPIATVDARAPGTDTRQVQPGPPSASPSPLPQPANTPPPRRN